MFLASLIRHHSHFIHQVHHWLLPPTCVICHYPSKRASNICRNCERDLPILSQCCYQCAEKLHSTGTSIVLCGNCLSNPPPFDCTHALFSYQTPIINCIIGLKFQHKLSIAKLFSDLLLDKLQHAWYHQKPLPDLIIPVPLHPIRLRERGFNQALEMARPLAKALSIPLETRHIRRIKHTQAQSGLSATERRHNIANAFAISSDVSNKSIAIVDDVMTTGYTIAELSKTLKRHGAKQIDVWCCARN
jgi:ComF family protein